MADSNHPSELIVVVNDNDKIIGYKPRKEVDLEGLRYRISALWVKNSKGEYLAARRAYTKIHYPGRWGPAAAGTNAKGETYLECMRRETREELNLKGIRFKKFVKIKENGHYKYFMQWFTCTADKPAKKFRIQKEEVAEVRWFSNRELRRELKKRPKEFVPEMKGALKLFG